MNDVFDGHFNQLIQTYSPNTSPMAFVVSDQQTQEVHIHLRQRFPKDAFQRVELLNPVFVPSA